MDCQFIDQGDYFKCENCGTVKQRVTRRQCPTTGGLGNAVARITSSVGIRKCGGCTRRQGWLNRLTPWTKRADVVLLFPAKSDPDWLETRGELVGQLLEKNGHTAFIATMQTRRLDELQEIIDTLNPRIIVNRAFFVNQDIIGQAARKNRGTRFVTVNHSSYAYTHASDNWIRQQAASIELAHELPNVFCAHVDERNIHGQLGLRRCIYFPNVVTQPEATARPLAQMDRPLVTIAGRLHLVKNQLQQMMAVRMVRDARALLVMKADDELPRLAADSIGLDYDLVPWLRWRAWHELLAERVAVGMQASFSESFNYVALEHMQLGRPVVGSTAIRYLPAEWQADADSPAAMAAVLRSHLDNWAERSEQAIDIAGQVMKRNNAAFLDTVAQLLKRKHGF
tara:strand:+ start:1057 stop:2244 length:1188 start_codon:yes stop_codon:yes gene_type:complete